MTYCSCGTTDGTLVMPGEAAATPNYTDPQTALGALDGWSTQNPLYRRIGYLPVASVWMLPVRHGHPACDWSKR
ncbi:MAG: hypothetical protein U5L02_15140 [Rheinheimera sp.]|nr:hypothetical protein [Rheinheimera sp.]